MILSFFTGSKCTKNKRLYTDERIRTKDLKKQVKTLKQTIDQLQSAKQASRDIEKTLKAKDDEILALGKTLAEVNRVVSKHYGENKKDDKPAENSQKVIFSVISISFSFICSTFFPYE